MLLSSADNFIRDYRQLISYIKLIRTSTQRQEYIYRDINEINKIYNKENHNKTLKTILIKKKKQMYKTNIYVHRI